MTNEELVERIRNGFSVTEDMQILYDSNLPLIKQYIKPYTAYETMEDCLQEAYFGLWEATKHYEVSENVKFMTYAYYWIKQAVQRYVENCGSVLRIPNHKRQQIARYKRTIQELSQELGRTPTDYEMAKKMCISEELLLQLKSCTQGIASLDTPLMANDNLTLCDTLQAEFSLENDVVEEIYKEHSKSELWDIVERYTDDRESIVIKEYFIQNKSMLEIAKEQGISTSRVGEIKQKGLNKLRMGKAKKELLEKFDILDAGMYRSGFKSYNERCLTSTVEYIAVRKAQIETEYKERMKQLEYTFKLRKNACL